MSFKWDIFASGSCQTTDSFNLINSENFGFEGPLASEVTDPISQYPKPISNNPFIASPVLSIPALTPNGLS